MGEANDGCLVGVLIVYLADGVELDLVVLVDGLLTVEPGDDHGDASMLALRFGLNFDNGVVIDVVMALAASTSSQGGAHLELSNWET
jgi:hypothetical protein